VTLSAEELGALADAFHDSLAARQLLEAAGLRPGRQPAWNSGLSALEFWRVVDRKLAAGAVPNGQLRLLRAAAETFPGNEVFAAAVALRSPANRVEDARPLDSEDGRVRSRLRRPRRLTVVSAAVAVLAVVLAVTAVVLSTDDKPSRDQDRGRLVVESPGTGTVPAASELTATGTTDADRSTAPASALNAYNQCSDGARLLWNHESKLYLKAGDSVAMGPEPSSVLISVVTGVPVASADCLVQVRSGASGGSAQCLDAREGDGALRVSWPDCSSDPSQQWIIHVHWPSEFRDKSGFLVYYHLLPTNDPSSCLQPAHAGPGADLQLTTCGRGYLQQWVVAAAV
jgi:effector-associated domain 1 (EAD1)-containing protein